MDWIRYRRQEKSGGVGGECDFFRRSNDLPDLVFSIRLEGRNICDLIPQCLPNWMKIIGGLGVAYCTELTQTVCRLIMFNLIREYVRPTKTMLDETKGLRLSTRLTQNDHKNNGGLVKFYFGLRALNLYQFSQSLADSCNSNRYFYFRKYWESNGFLQEKHALVVWEKSSGN